jgi:hypothetical protein
MATEVTQEDVEWCVNRAAELEKVGVDRLTAYELSVLVCAERIEHRRESLRSEAKQARSGRLTATFGELLAAKKKEAP